jgi:ubiquinone/menaquinone biosynthesis C-methylase UbiE
MADVERSYIPAAGHRWSLAFYDPVVKLIGGDSARRVLIEQAALQPGARVLEVGCGTGSLLMAVKRTEPRADVTGLDPDPNALARVQRKADAAAVAIRLDRGFSDALPYPDASFDRVFSCFMLHHLTGVEEKVGTLREIRRVLKPGGRLHLLDFAQRASGTRGLAGRLHSHGRMSDNVESRVLTFMNDAGLAGSAVTRRARMFFVLDVTYYQAQAPE